ncbi:hypothetical protein Tco_0943320 [Tanacetum coccineum]
MENLEQAFVDYASLRNNGMGGEENRNPSSPKRVHFVKSITIVSGIDKTKEDESQTSKIEENEKSTDIKKGNKGINIEDKACEIETNIGEEEEWMEYEQPFDLVHVRNESFNESLIEKMPSCSLNFNFRIERGNSNNLKISCMIGRKFITNAYINLGIGRDMHVFVGNTSYVMDFTILENAEANIDPSLSQVVFGRLFVEITKLILDSEKGLITFTDRIREVTFKTPYKDSKMDDWTSEGHDLLSSRVILSDDNVRRGCERAWDLESGIYKGIKKALVSSLSISRMGI